MKKTKIVGVCMVVIALASTVKDVFDGGGFSFNSHLEEIRMGLEGFGFYFLRDAISKLADLGFKL